MADTRDAVELPDNGEYHSVTTLTSAPGVTGIAAGVSVSIQVQGNHPIMVAISATKPSNSFRGVAIPAQLDSPATVDAGQNTVWLKGGGPVSIQEV